MHLSYWLVLLAGYLPVLTVGAAKAQKGYDNADPRGYLARLDGWRARADAAHRNGFEAFPVFAAGVIIAEMRGAPQPMIDMLSIAFIILRVVYVGLYIGNFATLRTLCWTAATACVVGLFVA
jgi:uncharacterized MAPEG superfamily protein